MKETDEIEAMRLELELIELMTGLTADDLEGEAEMGGERMAEQTRKLPSPRVH